MPSLHACRRIDRTYLGVGHASSDRPRCKFLPLLFFSDEAFMLKPSS